ncbi:hypothetical protein MMC13_005407 [Lambiella insularis]|nr:hypothetical protein [Lambiella insularis]
MAQSATGPISVSKSRTTRFHLNPPMRVNASKRQEILCTDAVTRPPQTTSNARDESIRQGRELYEQQRLQQCRELEEGSVSNLAYIQVLDQKQSILEIQAIVLGRLAADENWVRGLEELSYPPIMPFDQRINEVEEALRALQY